MNDYIKMIGYIFSPWMIWRKFSKQNHFWNTISPTVAELLQNTENLYQQYMHILNTKHNEINEINKQRISEVQALPGYRTSYTTICMHACKWTFVFPGNIS